MAFQRPQQQPTSHPQQVLNQLRTSEPQPERYVEDTEEWVLFSPSQQSNTPHAYTNSTERTPRTAGLSHLSDFGSLDTIARSHEDDNSQALEDDQGTELDSLDNHLHAFRETASRRRSSKLDQSGGIMLPAHDGLGTFAATSSPVQEQLYQFERFNPRRRRRRSNEYEGTLEEAREEERMRRIQEWRMEHSRVVLDEIEKATRRRRMSSLTEEMIKAARQGEDTATMDGNEMDSINSTNAARDDRLAKDVPVGEVGESLWQRITRHFIRDFMCIDDSMLSVLFGESLPETLAQIPETIPPGSQAREYNDNFLTRTNRSWEDQLFERLARELGHLMHHLSEHPGAFSTYLRTQEPPDYAGISGPSVSNPAPFETKSGDIPQRSAHHITNPSSPRFAPTLPFAMDNTAFFTADTNADSKQPIATESDHPQQQDREYWERELDVKMVFGFLRNRFSPSSRRPPSSHNPHTTPANLATTSTASAAARAALIRAHHPLVSRHQDTQRRRPSLSHRSNLTRSARRNSCRSQSIRSTSMSGSSRNFWDIGSSVGGTSGSALGIGAWGEI